MLSTAYEIPRSLVPSGPSVIKSTVVDIFPLTKVNSFLSSERNLEIPAAMDAGEKQKYLQKLIDERDFLTKKLKKDVPELPLEGGVEAVHKFFIDRGLAKLGLRNITHSGDKITADHCLIPHPAYSLYSEHSNPRLREFGANLGAALMLITSDGKLLLQHRKPENRVYGDVPGASIAGLVDAPKGIISSLDILAVVKDHILSESKEEVGFAPSVTESFELTSLQIDKVALHHELTFFSKTSRTADEIAAAALKNKHLNDPAAFNEHIVFLDATVPVIEKLLTEVLTPFPMTHAGPLLMLGYRLMQETQNAFAESWLTNVKNAMDENYLRIDGLSDDHKYTPSKSATAQGLPSFKDELQRLFRDEHRYVDCGK